MPEEYKDGLETEGSLKMKDIAESERPREKLLTHGARSLTNAELLAIQIGTGVRGKNVLMLAHQILHGADDNLYRLYQDLQSGISPKVKGLGNVKKANILAALELGVRAMRDKEELEQDATQMTNSQLIYNYIYAELYDLRHEELWLILLDQAATPRKKVRVSIGGLSSATADIRVILRYALQLSLPSIALVHNHPGGSLEPSMDDDEITERLYRSCKIIGINLLDHLICTDKDYYSYFDNRRFDSWDYGR